jgi:hypothetical protein
VTPGFSDHARQAKRAELVGDFAATATVVVAIVNMHGGHPPMAVARDLRLYLGSFNKCIFLVCISCFFYFRVLNNDLVI